VETKFDFSNLPSDVGLLLVLVGGSMEAVANTSLSPPPAPATSQHANA